MKHGEPLDVVAWNRKSAMFGGTVWFMAGLAALAEVPGLWLMETLFLLGPLVIVPLGVSLIAGGALEPTWALKIAAAAQPFAAIAVVVSFLFRPGLSPAVLVLPWLGVTCLFGLAGLSRLRQGLSRIEELCFSAALLYLPVGGIWLVISRLGETPMGLSEAIVLLTAVHFHFAGFGACCLAGAVGRAALAGGPRLYLRYRLPALGVIAGTFLVAVGFLVAPWPKFAAIVLFAGSLIRITLLQFSMLKRVNEPVARALLGVSASALMFGIALAVVYGLGEARAEEWISIPDMAKVHGVVNAIGFTLCGLIGWNIALASDSAGAFCSKRPSRPAARIGGVEVGRAV